MAAAFFSASYAEARQRFLDAAAQAGLAVQSHPHPLPGRDGEPLAMDVARDGPMDAGALLVLSSACHGVEGFCGSGAQVAALHDAAWRAQARSFGVSVLYLHALNPHGFSHLRRVTHENVDLNRNFHADFSPAALPVNPRYAELHPLLLPDSWPPDAENAAALQAWIERHGMAAYQAGISQGQHTHAGGMYFGGTAPTWSNATVRRVLREHGRAARRIGWIDVHTGLGPSGHGERIFAGRNDAAALERARAWWGGARDAATGGWATPITSFYDGSSTSAFLTGLLFNAAYDECPHADYTGIALEFGTQPLLEVLDALRGDHWLHRARTTIAHAAGGGGALASAAADTQAPAIARRMRDAFYTDTDDWKQRIVAQTLQALQQGAEGLAGSGLGIGASPAAGA